MSGSGRTGRRGLAGALARLRARAARLRRARSATHPAYMHFMLAAPRLQPARLGGGPEASPELVERIRRYLAEASRAERIRSASMWDGLQAARQPLIDAIAAGDRTAVARHFTGLFSGSDLDGMSHGNSLFADETRNPYETGFLARRTLDCLLSLAEAAGTAPLPSFGQRRLEDYLDYLTADHGELLARTEAAIGFSLEMPAVGAPCAVAVGNRKVAPDSLRHAYVAWRAAQLAPALDRPVLEIGGGYGMLALLAVRAGFTDWRIIDLPFAGCIQFGYLAGALGEDAVASRDEPRPRRVTIARPEDILEMADDSIGLVVNCDSLPEMGRETALTYLREIRRIAPRFLSINQEAAKAHRGVPQNRVGDLVAETGGFRRTYRFRHWMEQGYAEELYVRARD